MVLISPAPPVLTPDVAVPSAPLPVMLPVRPINSSRPSTPADCAPSMNLADEKSSLRVDLPLNAAIETLRRRCTSTSSRKDAKDARDAADLEHDYMRPSATTSQFPNLSRPPLPNRNIHSSTARAAPVASAPRTGIPAAKIRRWSAGSHRSASSSEHAGGLLRAVLEKREPAMASTLPRRMSEPIVATNEVFRFGQFARGAGSRGRRNNSVPCGHPSTQQARRDCSALEQARRPCRDLSRRRDCSAENNARAFQSSASCSRRPSTSSASVFEEYYVQSTEDNESGSHHTGEKKETCSIRSLASELGMEVNDIKKAIDVFMEYAKTDVAHMMSHNMTRSQFEDVLCFMTGEQKVEDIGPLFVEGCFKTADRDGNGSIDIQEFCLWYAAHHFTVALSVPKETREIRALARNLGISNVDIDRYKEAFDKFDVDHSGCIDFEEFCRALNRLLRIPKGMELPLERCKSLWMKADKDGSGEIDFEEFIEFYSLYFEDMDTYNVDGAPDPVLDYYKSFRRVALVA
eukprot:TRINITY_DN64047_c0_g1_i1.p1 TRINITY_DN64047_c0_g1~~TRINITY_DN64047_c0_g1_i1.p1  ORF type:complete len:518 (-),score=77.78 TRINITY_DN64047_c0_g1_i1:259-1812(-)